MAPPSKRLALFFDGTDNTPKDRTNVWRTHELIAATDANGVPQEKKYIKGVGTDIGHLASGSIFGAGVVERICDGYRWLVDNYQDDAEIYVFGFSRGAFTARSLVQMIANVGLTRPVALGDWSERRAFDRYEAISKQDAEGIRPIWRLRYWQRHPGDAPPGWSPDEQERRLLDDSKVHVAKVRMAGLWDTVGAIGADALSNQAASTQKAAAHNVRPTKAQDYGYHALAVDEHRPMFDATLWRRFVPVGEDPTRSDYKDYEQRWFIGAHSDVGGGYNEDSLPDLSFQWMLEKTAALGLELTHKIVAVPGTWHAKIHDSFEAFAGGVLNIWDKVIPGDQRHYREIGKMPRRVTLPRGTAGNLVSINETLDGSVVRRWTENPNYRPPGLVEYFRLNTAQLPPGTTLAQQTKRVYAANYWNETGVQLRHGRKYRVAVLPGLGEPLHDGSYTASSIAGENWTSVPHKTAALLHGKRRDNALWFALIGTIDKKHPWVIVDGSTFTVPVGGQLLCYFNDVSVPAFYSNNSGWIALAIEEI